MDCGSYHEKGTICGKCYSKVKTETEEIQDQLFKDDNFKYNYMTFQITLASLIFLPVLLFPQKLVVTDEYLKICKLNDLP